MRQKFTLWIEIFSGEMEEKGRIDCTRPKTTKARWTQDSRGTFGFLKLSQISKNSNNSILTSLKVLKILKV